VSLIVKKKYKRVRLNEFIFKNLNDKINKNTKKIERILILNIKVWTDIEIKQ
jgi:hypothetical protein